jgi:hypothetical protein
MSMVVGAPNPHERFYEKPARVTLLRKAAWNALLVPTCLCRERDFRFEKDGWLYCVNDKCGAPVRPLDGVEQLAPSLDEALILALEKVEKP